MVNFGIKKVEALSHIPKNYPLCSLPKTKPTKINILHFQNQHYIGIYVSLRLYALNLIILLFFFIVFC
jgi:hypothetical protein